MKVALVRPPNKGNTGRGVGFYAERLFQSLSKIPELELSWMNYSLNPFAYQKYDIVHFPYFDFYQLTLPIARISRTVVTVHDAIPLKFPTHFPTGQKAKTVWPIQKKILSKVDAIITDSEASRSDLIDLIKLPAEKISVTYLAADPEFKKITNEEFLLKIQKKFNLPSEFLLYVGGVNWNKNVAALLKATDTNIVLVGKEFLKEDVDLNHTELKPFKEILDLIKNKENIKRLGFVETEDLAGIYNLASAYVQPSIYEGFGLPLLEALTCGTPTVSGDGGSLKEVGGQAAIYADVNSPFDLKNKIDEVLKYSAIKKEKLSEKSLEQASKFSWSKTAVDTVKVYEKVMGLN